MSGVVELEQLLQSMNPLLLEGDFVFCHVSGQLSDYGHLQPVSSFVEPEGLSLVLSKSTAESEGMAFENTYRQITLTVHSSLEAVGLTAAVARQLALKGISANVIAAYFHDHIFVPWDKADAAMAALTEIAL